MYLIITNKNNESLDLLNNRDKFILSGAEGLHGIETDIATSETPYTDGTIIESVKALPRGIELTFTLRGDIEKSIELFTSVVKSKQLVTLREVKGERDLIIKGIATIPPYSRMVQSCKLVLTIYCGQPYWEDLKNVVVSISDYLAMLCFPTEGQYFTEIGRPFGALDTSKTKTFTNRGDTSVGMIITLTAVGDVSKPRISCSTGAQNGWYMQLDLALKTNDRLEISTVKNNKYITINGLDTYNGEPILNYLAWQGEDWLQLETGANTFSVASENSESDRNMHFDFIYKGRYE